MRGIRDSDKAFVPFYEMPGAEKMNMKTYRKKLEVGMASERRVFHAFQRSGFPWPVWLLEIKKATWSQDVYDGIDAVFETTRGAIKIQIKTSSAMVKEYIRKRGNNDVVFICLEGLKTPKEVFDHAVGKLGEKFAQMPEK